MRALDFSEDNLSNRWKYVNTNLKNMGIWPEMETKVKNTLKFSVESILWEEFEMQIGAARYQRKETRKDKRSGYYRRSLTTKYGTISISVPKARTLRPQYRFFDKYQRRHEHFDQMVAFSLILGMSTRKQEKFFREFVGDCVSHTTASKILNKLTHRISRYRNQPIKDEYEYIYLDAIWIKMKELDIKNRPILFAVGKTGGGKKKVLGFKFAKGESEADWLAFLNDLYRRGLKGEKVKLVISDNCKGLKAALNFIWPYVQLQLCVVHKLRNILSCIIRKQKHRKELMKDASHIFKAGSKSEAVRRIRRFSRKWEEKEPRAVGTLMRDIENYLIYYEFPAEMRDELKSTNPIESLFRQMRVMTRRLGYFQSLRSLDVFVFATLWEKEMIEEAEDENSTVNAVEKEEVLSYA